MADTRMAHVLCWMVIVWSLIGSIGAYRYFITPRELRFETIEVLWVAASFLGDMVLAVIILLLLKKGSQTIHHE